MLAELLRSTWWVFPVCTRVLSLVTCEPQALEAEDLPEPVPSLPSVPPAALGLTSLLGFTVQNSPTTVKDKNSSLSSFVLAYWVLVEKQRLISRVVVCLTYFFLHDFMI